jgi:hypothetical protein
LITKEDLVQILENCPTCMSSLLLNLELNGFVVIEDKQKPSLENTNLINHSPTKRKVESVEDWIDEWRNLFPTILNPHNLCMGIGNKQVCVQRMDMFVSRVSYNKERIFKATRNYLADCIKHGRKAKLPQYFILPQETGPLAMRNIQTGDLYDYYVNIDTPQTKDLSFHDF